ncbi:NmrA-like family domain-containing protein [Lachnellula willkommii]|uniref:NmrA-like family domain-containing protein n=1 Tax=Lachnellula willkommii TaxID=215461 RepID=A0A559MAU4_9HELO|nr:NmrA-like family domain-containing protein [Lachnellula willkommii]
MSKTLVVFGATGQQGSSVITNVLNDPHLSQTYKISAITRTLDSPKASALQEQQNVEVIQCDVSNRASLEAALTGAHTVFAMTTVSFSPVDADTDLEYETGKAIADVAVQKGAQYIIFSTLPPISSISGGKYTKVTPFDDKARIEQYIRGLPIKSAFTSLGSFMQNFELPFFAPQKADDGTYVIARHTSPETRWPLLDAVSDAGKFVGAILAEPDRYEGTTFSAAQAMYSFEEIAAIISEATGKTVVYKQIPLEEFKKTLVFDDDRFVEIFVEAFSSYADFGYYGKDTEKEVAWAAANARGKLTTYAEYVKAHPFHLE